MTGNSGSKVVNNDFQNRSRHFVITARSGAGQKMNPACPTHGR